MGNTRWKSSLNVAGNISATGNGTITGTLADASISTSAGIDVSSGTVDTLTSTLATITGLSSTNGTVVGFTSSNGTVDTRFNSAGYSLFGTAGAGVSALGVGTVSALHKLSNAGTVYGAWSSQGTAQKVHGGTAALTAGSVAVTTGMTSILAASVSLYSVTSPAAGTVAVGCAFTPGAGTLNIYSYTGIGGGAGTLVVGDTSTVSWVAIGL